MFATVAALESLMKCSCFGDDRGDAKTGNDQKSKFLALLLGIWNDT